MKLKYSIPSVEELAQIGTAAHAAAVHASEAIVTDLMARYPDRKDGWGPCGIAHGFLAIRLRSLLGGFLVEQGYNIPGVEFSECFWNSRFPTDVYYGQGAQFFQKIKGRAQIVGVSFPGFTPFQDFAIRDAGERAGMEVLTSRLGVGGCMYCRID